MCMYAAMLMTGRLCEIKKMLFGTMAANIWRHSSPNAGVTKYDKQLDLLSKRRIQC